MTSPEQKLNDELPDDSDEAGPLTIDISYKLWQRVKKVAYRKRLLVEEYLECILAQAVFDREGLSS